MRTSVRTPIFWVGIPIFHALLGPGFGGLAARSSRKMRSQGSDLPIFWGAGSVLALRWATCLLRPQVITMRMPHFSGASF